MPPAAKNLDYTLTKFHDNTNKKSWGFFLSANFGLSDKFYAPPSSMSILINVI